MALAYTVVALGVGQAADIFLPTLGAPLWTVPVILITLLLGFPIALVLAWGYDLTSIAVMPLANLSGDPGNEYFSDGITDDILCS